MITRRNFIGCIRAIPLAFVAGTDLIGNLLLFANGSSKRTWAKFAADLANALACLEKDEYLIVSKKTAWHYVQFAIESDLVRAEAVSNRYLDTIHKLSDQARSKLLALGWNPPTHLPDEADGPTGHPRGSPNYYLDFRGAIPYASVATLASATLRQIYGVQGLAELEYKSFARDGTSIRFPHLGIARRCKVGNVTSPGSSRPTAN